VPNALRLIIVILNVILLYVLSFVTLNDTLQSVILMKLCWGATIPNVIMQSAIKLNVNELSIAMLNVIVLSVVMPNVIVLSVVTLHAIVLNVIMLSAVAPLMLFSSINACAHKIYDND